MSEIQVDSADSTTAIDDAAASSADDVQDQQLDGEPEGEKPPVEEDPDVIRTRKTQERFDQLTGTIRDQKSEIDQLKRRSPVATTDAGAPKADDFDSDIDYAIAKGAYDGEQRAVKRINDSMARDEQDQVAFDQQRKVDGYRGRVAEAIKENPDFTRIVQGSLLQQQDQFGNMMPTTESIVAVDNGPAVALHIAQNPDLAASLNQASPLQAAMTVQRISSELTATPAKINDNPGPVGDDDPGAGIAAAGDDYPNSKGAKFY